MRKVRNKIFLKFMIFQNVSGNESVRLDSAIIWSFIQQYFCYYGTKSKSFILYLESLLVQVILLKPQINVPFCLYMLPP